MDHRAAAFENARLAMTQLAQYIGDGPLGGSGTCLDQAEHLVAAAQGHARSFHAIEEAEREAKEAVRRLAQQVASHKAFPKEYQPFTSSTPQQDNNSSIDLTTDPDDTVPDTFGGWDPHAPHAVSGTAYLSAAVPGTPGKAAPGTPSRARTRSPHRPSRCPSPIPLRNGPEIGWRGGIGGSRCQPGTPVARLFKLPPPPPPPPRGVFQTMVVGKATATKSQPQVVQPKPAPPPPPGQLRLSDGSPLI